MPGNAGTQTKALRNEVSICIFKTKQRNVKRPDKRSVTRQPEASQIGFRKQGGLQHDGRISSLVKSDRSYLVLQQAVKSCTEADDEKEEDHEEGHERLQHVTEHEDVDTEARNVLDEKQEAHPWQEDSHSAALPLPWLKYTGADMLKESCVQSKKQGLIGKIEFKHRWITLLHFRKHT